MLESTPGQVIYLPERIEIDPGRKNFPAARSDSDKTPFEIGILSF